MMLMYRKKVANVAKPNISLLEVDNLLTGRP
jgi:hypothetical protein